MRWWVVLTLAVMACGPKPNTRPPPLKVPCSKACSIQFTVRIDPAFTTLERQQVWGGLTTWTRASHGVVCYEPQKIEPDDGYNLVIVRGETSDSLRPFHDNYSRMVALYHASVIVIAVRQVVRGELDSVTAHEAGHALGFDHSSNPESIMHPITGNLVAGEIPLIDQRSFWSLRCK